MNRLSTAMQRFTVCIWTNASELGRLKLRFTQFANDLHDSALISERRVRLRKTDDKVDDMHNKVEDIHKYLFRSKRSATLLPSDAAVRQEIPLKPEVFYGRDDFVQDITRLLLQEETSRVCILGPGGMGKTSVSLAVVQSPLIEQRFPGGNLVWVPCIEATSATLLLKILYIQLQVPGDKQVTLANIISELDTSNQPRLILLDSFETPWNSPGGTQKQIGDILRRLAMLSHVAILVTMRGRYPPCNKVIRWQSMDIKAIDEAACLRIYHKLNPGSENDPDVSRLLAALGYMPLAVTLMAKLGVEGQSTANDLLKAWLDSGPDIFPDYEQNMSQSIRLSVESNLVKRNPNAITLLATLSLLPAGTTKENLRWWAPALKTSMIPPAIASLSQAALLVENTRENSASPVLFVVPVVQSFMHQHGRIAEEVRKQVHFSCCEYVLAHACRFNDLTFPNKSKALAAEDTNIQSILFSSFTLLHTALSDRTIEALIAFGWHYCDTKPNLEVANIVVAAAKDFGVEKYIASAVWCLGQTHAQLSDFFSSYNYLQEAYQLFNTFPLVDVKLQQLGGQCGIDFVNTMRLVLPVNHKGKVVSLARDVEKKCATLSDDLIHGRSLVALGAVLHRVQQWKKALRYLDHARTMLKAIGNTDNLSEACQIISWVHCKEGRLPEALDAIEEAWKYAKLTENISVQAKISLDFSSILFHANRDTEAWEYLELSLMKASSVGNQFCIAQTLEYMGYGYLRQGDYQNAYGAYGAIAKRYLGTVDAEIVERCKDNMAMIEQKQRNPGTVIGFERPFLDVDKTLFYPAIHVSMSELPISGS